MSSPRTNRQDVRSGSPEKLKAKAGGRLNEELQAAANLARDDCAQGEGYMHWALRRC